MITNNAALIAATRNVRQHQRAVELLAQRPHKNYELEAAQCKLRQAESRLIAVCLQTIATDDSSQDQEAA